MYQYFGAIKQAYSALQDGESKEIFMARIQLDIDPGNLELCRKLSGYHFRRLHLVDRNNVGKACIIAPDMPYVISAINMLPLESEKKILIYGLSQQGKKAASILNGNHVNFDGFVTRGAERYPLGYMGKPVYSSDWLAEHKDKTYLILAVSDEFGSLHQVEEFLKSINFPKTRILSQMVWVKAEYHSQYFDFMDKFPKGTAFCDCGCFDGDTSVHFAGSVKGNYSKIFAFEPDPTQANICRERLAPRSMIHDVEVLPYAVSDQDGYVEFNAGQGQAGHIVMEELKDSPTVRNNGHIVRVSAAKIDTVVGETKIGFIKMDIEGGEYSALVGAEETIKRDKPLLAISVYHRPGDVIAIMNLLQKYVPEYKFWLRHYTWHDVDTVLYAAI